MIILPDFDPVMVRLGPLAIRWYGFMYVLGFLTAWLLGRYRARKEWISITPKQVDDLITMLILGLVVGARLGYVVFYDPMHFMANPMDIVAVWKGGMSFHGGLLGMAFTGWLFGRRIGWNLLQVGDFVSPLAPPGLLAGRIGNFINGELWGRVSQKPWAMVFPGREAGNLPRHPSQLYEAALEGLILFTVLWIYSSRPRPTGHVFGLFLLLYGAFRFFVEFFREPDAQIGFVVLGWVTMGQVLCLPMVLIGFWLLWRKRKSKAA